MKAPFEHFFVGAACERAFAQVFILDAKEAAESAICALTEIGVIVGRQLSGGVEANLVERAREEREAESLIVSAAGWAWHGCEH